MWQSFTKKWSVVITRIAQVVTSLPEYWLAIIFIYYFGVKWHLFPFVGSNSWQYFCSSNCHTRPCRR